jgi:hypothetical protein
MVGVSIMPVINTNILDKRIVGGFVVE